MDNGRMEVDYRKGRDDQGYYRVRNGEVWNGQMDQEWQLWNNNYHQIVNILINIVKTFSPLRADTPEWYPTMDRIRGKTNVIEKRENSVKAIVLRKMIRIMRLMLR